MCGNNECKNQSSDVFNRGFCNCGKPDSYIDSKNSFVSELNSLERDELEELRKKVQIYEDLCTSDKLRDNYIAGWYDAKLAIDEGKFSLKTLEYNYRVRVEDVIREELDNLEKDDE